MVITVGGHFRMVNSLALEQAGVTKDTKDPVGGKFDRDKNGVPNGGLHETAIQAVIPLYVDEPIKELLELRSQKSKA
jgi:hypothetical protein